MLNDRSQQAGDVNYCELPTSLLVTTRIETTHGLTC